MNIYEALQRQSTDQQGNFIDRVWNDFHEKEREVYRVLIANKTTELNGTAQELADQLGFDQLPHVAAFMHGIHEAVDLDEDFVKGLEAETPIAITIDLQRLYKQMVAYKAKKLYTLPEWDDVFTPDEQRAFYLEEKKSHTVIRADKVGRNEPCPCGSGKKYKNCHGVNA